MPTILAVALHGQVQPVVVQVEPVVVQMPPVVVQMRLMTRIAQLA
ncbi:MAG TPA: hypothetical protein VM571_04170 [Noviherbaspirillum sp.]|nr:hypothetical protein [Noviherbaspirillum sp.]